MSFAIDVNILLYASDSGSEFHLEARRFLDRSVAGHEVYCLGWPTIMSYLRIATHPAIFARPLAPHAAMENIEALLRPPHARVLSEDERFWQVYREVAREVPTRGNLVPDAHLVALLRQHGVRTLYTLDRDFLKFERLDVRNPFVGW